MSTKEQLEKEKIQLEISELKRRWFKKPNYLQVLLPTTLAIFSLLYAITSGLFSAKQDLLELNKKRLETDIVAFQSQKEVLTSTNNNLKEQINKYNDSLQDRNLVLRKYENSFTAERLKIEGLNAEVVTLKNTKNDYISQIALLEKEYNNKKETYLKEIESKYYKEIDNDKKNKELQETIKKLNDNIADLRYNINILETNPFIKADIQYDYKSWTLKKMVEYYESQTVQNNSEIERLEKEMKIIDKKMDTLKVKRNINKIKNQ